MRASQYFIPTLRHPPKEAEIISHQLMLRAGMIQQIAAGIYAWLPLGLRVLNKIMNIVRQEQNKAGAIELLVPTLQPAALWQESGRYNDYGKELLRVYDRHERELLYGPTAEEVLTFIFRTHVHSYKDLPKCLYNIQWKFRDEVRPRFGVMRGREFLMKDTYSFDLTQEGAENSYKKMFQAYMKTFERMGLRVLPVRASTGPIGGTLSHEFHILAETGENVLYYDAALEQKRDGYLDEFYAASAEKHLEDNCNVPKERLKISRGIEVGHIFYFGTKYSIPLNAYVTTHSGDRVPVEMGSYGIGVSRLVGAIIEAFHDTRGIRWPVSVAPFVAAVVALNNKDVTMPVAQRLYDQLNDRGIDGFLYDLDKSAGESFADLDLVGFPYQVIVGEKWVHSQQIEIKNRTDGTSVLLSLEEVLPYINNNISDGECILG
jgi:prolyl-tRNA synthetase